MITIQELIGAAAPLVEVYAERHAWKTGDVLIIVHDGESITFTIAAVRDLLARGFAESEAPVREWVERWGKSDDGAPVVYSTAAEWTYDAVTVRKGGRS